MFTKILIANRGEIACRVAATARRMGIRTVAVYSEADAGSKHVAVCDEAVLIGPAAAKESYLRGQKIIEVAKATGAQAIHPGYGFLSENAEFAEAVQAAGLVFIGPPGSSMRAMGSKSAAKQLMEGANVPLVPGYHGENQDPEFLRQQADSIGYPVLLKASAGGGGKGMRVVERSEDFVAALGSCKREAISSFGDDKVLVEKYLTRPRHIEIQVFADKLGNCVYLHERDCSVQRRHQKVLEEAPAPGMPADRRAAMGEAAVNAARAVGYVGAGTVEFIANQDGSFYFMEMNTRLQVEHPVTEMITGTDLVEWQLRVAFGEPLPKKQSELAIHGHAIEARIYAENPEKGFLPSIGTLRHMDTPYAVNFELGGVAGVEPAAVRIDSGVREGDAISPFYDPMIAKLIVWGADRTQALARLSQALAEFQIVGLATNIAFLKHLVEGEAFTTADLDTGLIERNTATLFPPLRPAPAGALALAAVALIESEKRQSAGASSNAFDPWGQAQGWRLNGDYRRVLSFGDEYAAGLPGGAYQVGVVYHPQGWELDVDGVKQPLTVSGHDGATLSVRLGEQSMHGAVRRDGDLFHVFSNGEHHTFAYNDPMAHAGEAESTGGRLTAPMPGKVVAVLVEAGQSVKKGDALVIMEAMKMEHTIAAPSDGLVEEVLYALGDQVADGAPLLAFKAA
ncbi:MULTISPECIES: acetyl/propionyl/methylcrotonyl-CoA carboxylase subunit alpha [unclassified Massilia]|uniref:acetyl-CoA carboxylase biotin carboxylase subunit n=1 Tax=unclassified Massilia TaxID=2609279 RepID=UPI00177E6162|nr:MULTISPECIES: acetyl/propionyl/methylcrotonyl-CoA carboxylase subunit alpha [unclassified Massilia]MBD8531716.1 acetyl/propionyl/methylcrotonyl-CoA carboxylase subunit alpha [Massilia sp. CFBP 13647]MBD8675161.1 acetyl/propionyl/methylcrotonyl-CoA carboxylase subunit alpha [Massilia sp. CFBP 13721]